MAEILTVDDHPGGCTVCMAVRGPFVVFKLAGWIVQTVEGPLQVDTEIALCAQNDGREGCAGQLARVAGYIGPDEANNLRQEYADILDQHAALEAAHGELKASKDLDRKALVEELATELIDRAG